MSSQIPPEDIARSFGHSLRGYDPRQVDAYLSEVADELRRVRAQYLATRQHLGVLEDAELESQIENATSDINELLHTARVAAERMRERAVAESESVRNKADATAGKTLSEADADGYALRQNAWETSAQMLDQVERETAVLRSQAQRDALAIIGDAERTAHKKLSSARRHSEGRIRTAGVEAEQLLAEGRAERDEMMEQAARATDAAQERTRALERRREELMAELEDLRLQRFQRTDPPTPGAAETVRLVHPGEQSATPLLEPLDEDGRGLNPPPMPVPPAGVSPVRNAPFADGSEAVRLVKSSDSPFDEEVDGDQLADEVARLRAVGSEAAPAEMGTDETDTDETDTDEPDEAAGEDEEIDPSSRSDVQVARAWTEPASRRPRTDELGSLFRELRVEESADESPRASAADRHEPGKAAVEGGVSEGTAIDELLPSAPLDAFELRDTALLPITNRVLRDVKRQLADVQNIELDQLKNDPANWQPERSALEKQLSQELTIVERESFNAGYGSAATLLGVEASGRVRVPSGDTSPFISALFDDVVLTVQASRESGHTAQMLGAEVSRVYRVWRTDEAERRLRHLAGAAYHNGLLRGLADGGATGVEIAVHGSCGSCKVRADMGVSVSDSGVLPVHEDCRCTIVPG
jgi:DivIVA domain-containing protein